MFIRPLLAAAVVIGAALPAQADFYYLRTEGLVVASPSVTAFDEATNGTTAMCTPTGPGPCAPISAVNPAQGYGEAFASVDLPAGAMQVYGIGWPASASATFQINGHVSGLSAATFGPGDDVILHLEYGWDVTNGGFGRLQGGAQGGFTSLPFDTSVGSRFADADLSLDLAVDVAAFDGYLFQFHVTLSTGGNTDGSSFAWLYFWLELPEGASVLNGVATIGNVPLADPLVAVPAPGGLALFALALLVSRRRAYCRL